MFNLWRKYLIEYFRDNRENTYTANDIEDEDSIILFKNEAGANWYDRIIPISLFIDYFGGKNKFAHRDNLEVANQGQTEFTLSFEPSDIAMVFVAGQLKGVLDYSITDDVITFYVGLNKYDKLTVIG